MIDETYKPMPGRLSDRDIAYLCIGDKPMISPFLAKQVGKPSAGLSSSGYDFRLGGTFYVQATGHGEKVIDPLSEEDQEVSWQKREAVNNEIIIHPGECILTETIETIDMPDDVVATVLGKSTYARNNIIVNATPLECFDDKTEILTQDGWRYFEDVSIGDVVATMNKSGALEYRPIQALQKAEYSGELVSIKGKSVDLLVTPEHSLYARKQTSLEFELVKAESVEGFSDLEMKRDAFWCGDDEPVFVISGSIDKRNGKLMDNIEMDSDSWCKFFGLWLAEGSAYKSMGGDYVVKVACTSNFSFPGFRKILDSTPFKWHESKYGFETVNKQLAEYLMRFGHSNEKYIPPEIKGMSRRLLFSLVRGYMLGDGCITTMTGGSTSKALVDGFQEIGMKIGFPVTYWVDSEAGTAVNCDKQYSSNFDYLKFRFSANQTPRIGRKENGWGREEYSGYVYDVTVPNHTIYVRRNGKAVWSGNCGWRGVVTLELHNCSNEFPVLLRVGQGIAQCLFDRMPNPPARTYSNRESGGVYQDQSGVTTSK